MVCTYSKIEHIGSRLIVTSILSLHNHSFPGDRSSSELQFIATTTPVGLHIVDHMGTHETIGKGIIHSPWRIVGTQERVTAVAAGALLVVHLWIVVDVA